MMKKQTREYGVEDNAGNTLIWPSATTKRDVRKAALRLATRRDESVYLFEVGKDNDGTSIVVDREEISPPQRKASTTIATTPRHATTKKKTSRQLDREIAAALTGQASNTGSVFYDFLLERFPSGDVPWPWVQKILKEHGVPLPLMIGLGKEEAAQYGIQQGKTADVQQLAKFLGY